MLIRGDQELKRAVADGRQSEQARMIQRGVGRLLYGENFSVLYEVTLASGRRADILALSDKGQVWGIEIKSSLADFQADQKWPEYQDYCDQFYFATHPEVLQEIFPPEQGLIMADAHGAEIIRPAPDCPLTPARRKALTLRFARAAAARLHQLHDPGVQAF